MWLPRVISTTTPPDKTGYLQLFKNFKTQYGKNYKSKDEEAKAFEAFIKNSEIIDKRNSEKRGITLSNFFFL